MGDEITERKLGKAQGCRLFTDQESWLADMEAKRSAKPHAIIRAAVDHYRPVFEALNQTTDPEVQALANEAALVVGADLVRETLQSLLERRRAPAGSLLSPDHDTAAASAGVVAGAVAGTTVSAPHQRKGNHAA